MKTHYETLGVPPSATSEELSVAFRALGQKLHPDIAMHTRGGQRCMEEVRETFADVTAAYSVLKDPKKRAEYDKVLALTVKACTRCKGTGTIGQRKGFTAVIWKPCPQCNGTGKQ